MQSGVFQRINELCEKIQREHNPQKFAVLIEELNRLLDDANTHKPGPPKTPATSTAA